jgi:hypothetical protein
VRPQGGLSIAGNVEQSGDEVRELSIQSAQNQMPQRVVTHEDSDVFRTEALSD